MNFVLLPCRQQPSGRSLMPANGAASHRSIRQQSERRLLEMVASGHALADTLHTLCAFVEGAVGGDALCGVFVVEPAGERLRTPARTHLPVALSDATCNVPLESEAGPCARAVRLKRQVIVADVESDSQWAGSPFATLALAHGKRSCWSTPIFSLPGHVIGTLVVLQDRPAQPTRPQQSIIAMATHIASIAIERERGHARLRRSEAFFDEAQRLSLTGSFSWRVATDDIAWSDQLYRIFEFDKAAPLTFERIASRFHPDDLPPFWETVAAARIDGRDIELEHRLLMPDGLLKCLRMMAHATRDSEGRLEYIGAVQDVTERRVAEQALDRARSELARVARVMSLGALTASIAHEVNQPLSGILTNASTCLRMLSSQPPDVGGAEETARRTLRDGHRASDVIARLRALFAKKETKSEPVDLNDATREVITLSLSELQRNHVIVRAELADDLPPVCGDRVQLQQVVLNLLVNASDAMGAIDDRPRYLLVRTARDGADKVRLSVRDVGAGMDAVAAAKLFEPFWTTKPNGMGIGLFVSRSIIESHRGCLQVTANDGPGVTFWFSIPRQPESARCPPLR